MTLNKLTDKQVKSARCPLSGEVMLSDGGGLYLLLRKDGAKYWQLNYRYDGRKRKRGLGSYAEVKLADARAAAEVCRAQLTRGEDPVEVKRQAQAMRTVERQRLAARKTVRELFDLWQKRKLKTRKDGGADLRRAFEKDVFSFIGNRFADEVTKQNIRHLLQRVVDRGVNRMANVLLAALRQMFNYAVLEEIIPTNPAQAFRAADVGGSTPPRERVLSLDELSELARKLPASGLPLRAQTAAAIMLATCCRVGELSRARWQDLDLEAGTWTIPAANAKNGHEHLIHLSEFAKRQFTRLVRLPDCDWVYPGTNPELNIDTKSIQKLYRDRQRVIQLKGRSGKAGALCLSAGKWTAHDLRRTGATMMGELKVRSDVIDRCLNHVEESKVKRTYQRQELIEERREAFNLLGEQLNNILHL